MVHDQSQRSILAMAAFVAAAFFALTAPVSMAQAWKPEKAVEVVVSSAPGGSNDRVARIIQKIVQEQKLVATPVARRDWRRSTTDACPRARQGNGSSAGLWRAK